MTNDKCHINSKHFSKTTLTKTIGSNVLCASQILRYSPKSVPFILSYQYTVYAVLVSSPSLSNNSVLYNYRRFTVLLLSLNGSHVNNAFSHYVIYKPQKHFRLLLTLYFLLLYFLVFQ